MIDIDTITHLFKVKICDSDICFYSFENNDEDIADFSIEELSKINLLKAINKELPYEIEPQDLNSISNQTKGKVLTDKEFLGWRYNEDSNCLYLSGKKIKNQFNYFLSPYVENSENLENNLPLNRSSHQQTFLEWFELNGSQRMTNKEINDTFLKIKYHLLDREKPIIYSWKEKWLHLFDDYNNIDETSWTLYYPNSNICIILLIVPYL